MAETLRDEDVQRLLTAELTRAVDAVEVAPLAGRALRLIIAGGHHSELFNAILSGADRYLVAQYGELRELFEAEAPRWVPDAVNRRLFDRLYNRLRQRLAAMAADPTTRSGSSSGSGSPGSPAALRHPRSCVRAASASSTTCWVAKACGTGPRRCGRRPRRSCGSKPLTRSLSCAAGCPMHW